MDLVCADKHFLQNPQKLPLNKLYLQYDSVQKTSKTQITVAEMLKKLEKDPDKHVTHYSVKSERVSAIDKCWIHQNRRYATYQPYYVQFDEKENSQFLEKNQLYLDCLQFFAGCTFQQFWCYVACEPGFPKLVINFLENAVPPFAVKYLNEKCLALHNKIYSCIYRIYQRLISFSVSETEYIEEDAAVKYLQKSNLISSHVLMNFCYLFSHSQKKFVQKLISYCYSSRFKDIYVNELATLFMELSDDLDYITMRSKLGTFNPMYVEETACYMLEAADSLLTFTTFCKPAMKVALEQQLPHRLPHIYQKVYLDLYDMYDTKGDLGYDWSKLDELINQWLALGRQTFIELSHNFIGYCLQCVLEYKKEQCEQDEYLEVYLALISTALDDEFFMRDYNHIYPIKDQFQLLTENIPNFDKSQTEYLLQSLSAITVNIPENTTPDVVKAKSEQSLMPQPFPQDVYEVIYNTLSKAVPGPNQPENVTEAIHDYEQLRDQWELNPNCWIIDETPEDLEDALEVWNLEGFSKPSEAEISNSIAAVKEMLPELDNAYILAQLECVDYRPELVISRVLDKRISISESKKMVAHIGKKPQHNDAKDLLDDKKDDIKNLVLKASYNYEDDDDYDDRNDINNTFDPDKDDSKLYRHLKQNNLEYDVISDPSSSEDETQADAKPSNAFCEDPAVVRARRAAQRGRVFKPTSHKPADVTGKPKGQGQEASVQHSRDKKNVQKSSRANHNRKGGAQWKRSRGMMPS